MSISLWLLTGMLMGAPPSVPIDAVPAPHLEKGLELIWRGTFSEAILRPNVRAFRNYEVETRLFVVDCDDVAADVALFTLIKLKPDLKTIPEPQPIIRLELARVESNGKIWLLSGDSLSLAPDKRVPLPLPLISMEGLPTFEPAVFMHFPVSKQLKLGQAWSVAEAKRPPINYRLDGTDTVRGSRCLKVVGVQQTDDWNKFTSETTAWRRGETIWVSAKHGYAARIERITEKRDPQSGELGFRSKLSYEQVGYMRYPDRFGEDRRAEIALAAQLGADFEHAVADPGRADSKPFEQIVQRIERHVITHFSGDAVPYREAVAYVKRKAEAAKRGHIPPVPTPPETADSPPLVVGKSALDVTAVDLTNRESITLSKLRGKTVLLIYYQPASARTAEPVMRLANSLSTYWAGKAVILPVAIGDSDKALQQQNDWAPTVHLLAGKNIHKQHGIDSTPCFILVDEQGIVRNIRLGWSEENAEAIGNELEKWVR